MPLWKLGHHSQQDENYAKQRVALEESIVVLAKELVICRLNK